MLRLEGVGDFGDIAAESDQLLTESFVRTSAFRSLIRQERFVAIGRKGTGKTALYREIAGQVDHETFIAPMQFEDYNWKLHDDVRNTGSSAQERFVHSWYFLMLVELAKLALRDEGAEATPFGREIRQFIETIWESLDFDFRDFYKRQYYLHLKGEVKPTILGASIGSIAWERIERSKLGDNLPSTLKWLEAALVQLLRHGRRYFLLFDGLDRGFSPKDESYRFRLTGLLLSAARLATWSKGCNLRARAVLFIGSHVFDALQFSDKNKIYEASALEIKWTDHLEGSDSLMSLMRERIRAAIRDLPSATDPWTVVHGPLGPQGEGQSAYEFMTARTYLRPRDMIKFANLALLATKRRLGRTTTGNERIELEDIRRALPNYSAYLVRELDDEVGAVEPEWKRYLGAVGRIGKRTFTRAELIPEISRLGVDADVVLERLYEFSVIGYRRAGTSSWRPWAYSYQDPLLGFSRRAREFCLHPGLLAALQVPASA